MCTNLIAVCVYVNERVPCQSVSPSVPHSPFSFSHCCSLALSGQQSVKPTSIQSPIQSFVHSFVRSFLVLVYSFAFIHSSSSRHLFSFSLPSFPSFLPSFLPFPPSLSLPLPTTFFYFPFFVLFPTLHLFLQTFTTLSRPSLPFTQSLPPL